MAQEVAAEAAGTELKCSAASTTGVPKPLRFMDLSVDIKSIIIQYLIRPTDLKNVCLTCKQLHEIAVRPLYREVTVEVGSSADTRLTSLVNPRNIGLPYIRKLDLYLADGADKTNHLSQAHFAVRMLLEFLPENILEKFSWHPWSPFSLDNLIILYRKQRRLKWLEAISLDRPAVLELEKWPEFDSIFSNVTKLGLYPDSRDVLDMCASLVQRSSKVEKMTLHASFEEDHDSNHLNSRELNDSSIGPGLISRTIFGHLQPFEKCTPMALRDLTLQKINLRYSADTYARFIDFKSLKALRVFACSGADSLFAELSKSDKLPPRLEMLEFKHDDSGENDGLNAIEGFLCLISGLRVLTIDLCFVRFLPATLGIIRHSRTLQELNVHASRGDGEEEEIVYNYADFETICKNCSKLEQLSLAFPVTSILRGNTDQFVQFQNALSHVPELVTLNITTWPVNTPSSSRLPRKIYEHLLQAITQAGFERALKHAKEKNQSSKLAVIAWGASDKVYDREDSKNQIIFVKGRQIDPFGKESPLAVQVGWCLRKYIELRSEVLDFALSRTCRPPTREPPSSDDSE